MQTEAGTAKTRAKPLEAIQDLEDLRRRHGARVDRSGGEDACHPWTGKGNRKGYGVIVAGGYHYLAHRVALLLEGRPPQEGQLVRHLCGAPACQNPRHLLAGTHGENMQDRTEAGNDPAGERNGRARLSWQDVAAIRAAPRTRGMQTRLTRAYGVSVVTINLILHGKTWRT